MPEPTMGEMARWTYYQRYIAERTGTSTRATSRPGCAPSTRRSTA